MMCLSNEIYRLKIVKKKEKIACELFTKIKRQKKEEINKRETSNKKEEIFIILLGVVQNNTLYGKLN